MRSHVHHQGVGLNGETEVHGGYTKGDTILPMVGSVYSETDATNENY